MKTQSNSLVVRYAVIQVRQSDGNIERFVMGYRDKRSLRDLLDKRSIVATGFLSRDEATRMTFTSGLGYRMNNVVQIGGTVLRRLPFQWTRPRQQLEPVVQ
jgi:hypothetical protein